MKLLRLASIYFFNPQPEGWTSWKIQFGEVTVSTIPINKLLPTKEKLHLIVKAEVPIQFPEIDEEGYVILNELKRQQCETALINITNLIAVFGRCKRSIASTSPSVALVIDNAHDRDILNKTKGFRTNRSTTFGHHFQIPYSDDLVLNLLDRPDGVALIAEAYCHNQEAGQYHEYVRFFEAAFALQFSQLGKKLLQFLPAVYGYTRQEINDWINMRDPITHADGKKKDYILLSGDVRKVIQRMEQAALEVLFNKLNWHASSRNRRNLWTPVILTTSPNGDIIIKQGSTPKTKFQLFDEFNAFPMDLQAFIETIPENWWVKFESTVKVKQSVSIIDDKSGTLKVV